MTSAAVAPLDAVNHFTDWVQWLAPCGFAPMFARRAGGSTAMRMHFVVARHDFVAEQVARAEAQFDMAATEKKFAGILWPHVRTVADLMRALSVFARTSDRWRVQEVAWGDKYARPSDMLLDITWRTSNNERTSVMGFMPHGSMPVPRRSAYAAVVFWPGTRDNPHVNQPEENVGFIDGEHRLDRAEFISVRKASTQKTKTLLREAPEDVERFRKVAFSLPRREIQPHMRELQGKWTFGALYRAARERLV